MRTLTRWAIKLSIAGVLYIAMTHGTRLKLPETIVGFQVPPAAQQLLDQGSDIAGLGDQGAAGLQGIADSFGK
jgi:hypothetical protein